MSKSKVEIVDLQNKALDMLKDFDDFCTKYDLRYFVIGGAAIGAVRDGDLIPWDDDIDLFMPRPDYEKLYELWDTNGNIDKYTLCRTTKEQNIRHAGMLFKDNNTTFINRHSIDLDIHHGYMLDIIPIDGCAPSGIKRKMQKLNAAIFSLFNFQRLPDNQGQLVRTMSKIIFAVFRGQKIRYKLWSSAEKRMTKYDFDESEYITELITGFKYMQNEYPKEVFTGTHNVEVRDTVLKLPKGYDTYLTMAFGDYMVKPEQKEREPKHDTVFIDLDNSYLKYKGDKYLNE